MHGRVIDLVMARSKGIFSGSLAEVDVKARIGQELYRKEVQRTMAPGCLCDPNKGYRDKSSVEKCDNKTELKL